MELEAVRKLVQERGSDLAFVVNHSGGKDSTRMLGFVRNKFREYPTYVAMADTGFEHQRPISAADFARQRCAEFGLNLTVVRNPKRTYLEMVERRGMFPSPRFRQCTSDLKRSPVEKFIRTLPQKVIVNCIGIRAEESHSRSRLVPLTVNASLTTREGTVYNWLPIFDQSLADVLAWHWVNAVRLHPVYVATLGKTKGHVKDIQGMMRHSKASTTTDVYMQSLEPEVRTAINSIYAELVGTGTTGPGPERPVTFGQNTEGREADHGAYTQARSSTMEPKNGSGREEKKTAVPSRGKILQFAGKMRASDLEGDR